MISTKVRFYFVLNDRFLAYLTLMNGYYSYLTDGFRGKWPHCQRCTKCCILIHILPSLFRSLKLMYQLDIIVKWLNLFRRVVD